jgi:quercetin dioxygenase-like cupin family protein
MHGVLDLFGPTVEFLTSPNEADAVYCVMIGTIPPGGAVPIHRHADDETFYVLSGGVEVLSERGDKFEWLSVKEDDCIHIPGNARHAFRNTSGQPVVQLITTTPKLARFFQEVGRPVTPATRLPPPTPDDLQHFARVSTQYGYWNGSPADNAAIGLSLSFAD